MKNKKNNKKYIIIGADDFSFKTISSTCDAFNISGSIAYNDKKSAIYITNIKYCAGDDTKEYEKIDYLTNNNPYLKLTCRVSFLQVLYIFSYLNIFLLDNRELKIYQEELLILKRL